MHNESFGRVKAVKPGSMKPAPIKEPMPAPISDYAGAEKRSFIASVSPFMPFRGERTAYLKAWVKHIISGNADQFQRIPVKVKS